MTLVFIGKDLVLERSTTKIGDKWVPGMYNLVKVNHVEDQFKPLKPWRLGVDSSGCLLNQDTVVRIIHTVPTAPDIRRSASWNRAKKGEMKGTGWKINIKKNMYSEDPLPPRSLT